MSETTKPAAAAPRNPYLVLAAAIVLPGCGHVLNGVPQRGLVFLFFIILLGWASVNVMPDGASFFGRYIGGVFVYGISVIDAYQMARVNWEKWKYTSSREDSSR
jgi:putative effector of murein hydrolase LrgA (UPF0299 family)